MRRLGDWGEGSRPGIALLAAWLVVLGVAGGAAADDQDDSKSTIKPGGSWFSFGNWFGTDKKPADPKPAATTDRQGGKGDGSKSTEGRQAGRGKAGAKISGKKEIDLEAEPGPAELAARRRVLEEAALLRRDDVCDRLAEIAVETNNPELANLAEQLKQRAWEVYSRRTTNLTTVTQAVNPDAEPGPARAPQPGASSSAGPVRNGQPLAGREDEQ